MLGCWCAGILWGLATSSDRQGQAPNPSTGAHPLAPVSGMRSGRMHRRSRDSSLPRNRTLTSNHERLRRSMRPWKSVPAKAFFEQPEKALRAYSDRVWSGLTLYPFVSPHFLIDQVGTSDREKLSCSRTFPGQVDPARTRPPDHPLLGYPLDSLEGVKAGAA